MANPLALAPGLVHEDNNRAHGHVMEEACDGSKAHGGGWSVSWIAAGAYKDARVGAWMHQPAVSTMMFLRVR